MIALTPLQQELYQAAKAFMRPVAPLELCASLGWYPRDFWKRVKACRSKGYIAVDSAGAMVACEPPHDRIMREVCAANGLQPSEVHSSYKSMKLTRARRTIALRLQKANYSFQDIASAVHRHPSTVLDYLFQDRAALRSQRRSAELKLERASA